ncbi:hypothetical protein MMC34_005573 [Xylographa carneopallida]|nr:hypothetical protein [Xylographa carneopallida]
MDTILQHPGSMFTELPTLISSSHSYASHLSPQDIRWRLLQMPTPRPKQASERRRQSLDPQDLPELLEDTLRLQAILSREAPDEGTRHPQLQDLPEEIQQGVLDILMGMLSSTSSSGLGRSHGMRNWSNVMRHPRGRHHSDLALVSRTWRRMIQERLYRHVKIKGTKQGLEEAADWFLLSPHLQLYVRHIEIWVPVWERRAGQPLPEISGSMTLEQHERPHTVNTMVATNLRTPQEVENINQAYQLASSNSTLDEIFGCVSCLFPEACILTIEGGHCKKPPMIQQFRTSKQCSANQKLSELPKIRTLILKGAWNVMREDTHFVTLKNALPNLREWHTTYAKPKTKAYRLISSIVPHIPATLTHLNLCLEGFYSKDTVASVKMRQLQLSHHLCRGLGRLLPQLEAFTFTGRVCSCLFATAVACADKLHKPRLKSIDLIVKNCCRDPNTWNDGTGIHNWGFIKAFEALVVASVRSLEAYPELTFLRIRFIDLDSPCPLLNPYFQLQRNICSGIWNDDILSALNATRPRASFSNLGEELGLRGLDKEGRTVVGWPVIRPKSIKVASYAAFDQGILGSI